MRPDAPAHLWDASEAAKAIRLFTANTTEDAFLHDLLRRSAVERQLEILGEALNRLRRDGTETAAQVPELDKIVGMRNVIAHEYGDLDYKLVWSAVITRVPRLIPVLAGLLKKAGPPE